MRDCITRMSLKYFSNGFSWSYYKKCFWPSSKFIHVCVNFFIIIKIAIWLIYQLIINMSIISSCSQLVKGFKTLSQVHWRVLSTLNPSIKNYDFYNWNHHFHPVSGSWLTLNQAKYSRCDLRELPGGSS